MKKLAIVIVLLASVFTLFACASSSNAVKKDTKAESHATDQNQITSSDTTTVKGINGWEGTITGQPVPGSIFEKLQIGMDMKDVLVMIGEPNSKSVNISGKAFIPFYYGSGSTYWEYIYYGHGRLIFSRASRYSSRYNLTEIIYVKN